MTSSHTAEPWGFPTDRMKTSCPFGHLRFTTDGRRQCHATVTHIREDSELSRFTSVDGSCLLLLKRTPTASLNQVAERSSRLTDIHMMERIYNLLSVFIPTVEPWGSLPLNSIDPFASRLFYIVLKIFAILVLNDQKTIIRMLSFILDGVD